MNTKRLSPQRRKDIFFALVQTQDTRTMSVSDSHRCVQTQFGITPDELEEIIKEGVEKEWLDELAAA